MTLIDAERIGELAPDPIRHFTLDRADDRHELQQLFDQHVSVEQTLTQTQADFDKLIFATVPQDRDKITKALIEAEGLSFRGMQEFAREQTDYTYKKARSFSLLFAEHCQATLNGEPLVLADATYEYTTGLLVRTDLPLNLPSMFADIAAVQANNRGNVVSAGIMGFRPPPMVKLAGPGMWQKLLGQLNQAAQP